MAATQTNSHLFVATNIHIMEHDNNMNTSSQYLLMSTLTNNLTTPLTILDNELSPKNEMDGMEEPPDGGLTAWLVVFASFMVHFVSLGTLYSFGIFTSYYIDAGIGSPGVVSLIGSIGTAVFVGLGLVSGRLAERFGFNKVIFLGTCLTTLGLLLASFSKTVIELCLTQGLLFGIGCSFTYFPAVSAPSQWFSKRRGIATGLAVSGSGLGGLAMSLVSQELLSHVGFAWTMRINAMFSFVSLCAIVPLVKTRFPPKAQSKMDWNIFKNFTFLCILFAGFFATFSNFIPIYFLQKFAQERVGLSLQTGATLLSIYNLSSAAGRIIMGLVSDKLIGPINSLVFCFLVSSITMLFLWTFASSFFMLILFSILNGFVCGGYISLTPVVTASIFGTDKLASLIGAIFSASALANLLGAPIAGAIKSSVGFTGVTLFAGGLTTIAAIFSFCLRILRDKRIFVYV